MKTLRSFFTITLIVYCCTGILQAQTTLEAGDIAFIGLYTSGSGGVGDAFTFITLKAIPEGTIIYFTDDGWNNSVWGGSASEVHFTWSPPAGVLPIGTIVTITGGATNTVPGTPSVGTCSATFLSGTTWHYPTGEEILAYQSSTGARPASPTFIAGVLAYYNTTYYDATTKWCSSIPSGNTEQASTLPNGLTNGTNSVSVVNANYTTSIKNCRYNGSLTGTASEVRALINSDANWTRSTTTPFDITSAAFLSPNITADPIVITFADGSVFTQSLSSNSNNQVLGRFQLTGDASGATLTAASIKLNNARTGLSNVKLWSSTDATFSSGSDTQLGSTVAADPGDGNSVSFSSLSSSISTGGTYYFITGDISASPTGTVQGVVVQNSSLTISGGALSGSITNAALSSNNAPLPVELISITASGSDSKVTLNWQTATEVNNYGFEIERKPVSSGLLANSQQLNANGWSKIGFVEGNGTTNAPKSYSFVDVTASGKTAYRLKQIDRDGKFAYSQTVEVTISSTPKAFALMQNFPNPFNPTTMINYQLPMNSHVTLKVYDAIGKEVATLVNEVKEAGSHTVQLSMNNYQLSSGMYFYKLQAGNFTAVKKLTLMK